MKDRPILFNSEMVRALLDGRKTETRRVIKPQLYPIPESLGGGHGWADKGVVRDDRIDYALEPKWLRKFCPYGVPGDRLWVRETCFIWGRWHKNGVTKTGKQKWRFRPIGQNVLYSYDGAKPTDKETPSYWKRQSIFMPRWASRITLEITDIRVERVQDITESGTVVEGWPSHKELFPLINTGDKALTWYRSLWNKINAKRGYSFDSNPWVWVIKFKAVSG